MAADGQLKIADFGLARDFADPGQKMTCQVITRFVLFTKLGPCYFPFLKFGLDGTGLRNYYLDVDIIVQLLICGLSAAFSLNLCFGFPTCQVKATWISSKRLFERWELQQKKNGGYVYEHTIPPCQREVVLIHVDRDIQNYRTMFLSANSQNLSCEIYSQQLQTRQSHYYRNF